VIHKEQAEVKSDIEALKRLKQNPEAHGLNVNLRFSNSGLANASWNTARETGAFSFMGYPEVKKYAEVYDTQKLFGDQTTRVTSAYTNSFSVLYIFDVDEKAATAVKNDDVTAAIQKVLAVQSELMVYDSIARELDRQYSESCSVNSDLPKSRHHRYSTRYPRSFLRTFASFYPPIMSMFWLRVHCS
jgi:hypothetical protein